MNYLQALAAYVLWGIFPLYWKLLSGVDSVEVICHRIVWALLTLIACVGLLGQWPQVIEAVKDKRRFALTVVAACLISLNWLVFIWAVQHGAVVQSSLGYFINPLLNVLLGVLLFGERLVRVQWIAVAIAALGLAIMTISSGSLSWIAMALAISFAFYAVVKKWTQTPAVAGLGLETAVLLPLAVAYLLWISGDAETARSPSTYGLLALGGPITTLPLVLFAASAKSVPLAVMGMLQYIAPSLQFLLGVWLYNEPIDHWQFVGFACVWSALALLTAHTINNERLRSIRQTQSTSTSIS